MTAMRAALASRREPSGDVFALVGAFLAEHRLSADPANYAFAHSIVCDPDSAAAADIARISDGGFRLSAADIQRLGGSAETGVPIVTTAPLPAAAAADAMAEAIEGLIARTQVQVDGFARTMHAMHGETREFGKDLVAAIDSRSPLPAIDEVVRLTSAMIERVRLTEVRLETATRETEELRAALDEAHGSARRDPLTDLPNRRAFDEAFTAIEAGTLAAVAICDIDHFKAINDQFGHAIGDRVLRAIGQTIAGDCPDCLVARYGGEEFVVLVTGEGIDAAHLLEAARERIARKRFRMRDSDRLLGTITFSAGLSAVREGDSLDTVLARADAALYAAKADGRNCVKVAPNDGG